MTPQQAKRLEMELSRNQEFNRIIEKRTKPVNDGLFLLPIIKAKKGWSLKDIF